MSEQIYGIIYVAERIIDRATRQYVCYDGNNRRMALNNLPERNVYVQVMFNASEREIIDRFHNLNLSNPVPNLYLDKNIDNKFILKNTINETVEYLCSEYSNMLKTSIYCKRPHFNRSLITTRLYNRFDEEEKYDITSEELIRQIEDLNELYKHKPYAFFKRTPKDNITESIMNKCSTHNCYIFMKYFENDLTF